MLVFRYFSSKINLKRYYYKDIDYGDSFFFVMNDKVYEIYVDKGILDENIDGIDAILTAWLNKSTYK